MDHNPGYTEQPSSPAEKVRKNIPAGLFGRIMDHFSKQPEGATIRPADIEHPGDLESTRQAMSELSENGRLRRIWEDIFVQMVETKFGARAPHFQKVVENLAEMWNETIVPSGGASANVLGLTTQVPVIPVYLTSGPNRTLNICSRHPVELRNAPWWQLAAPNTPAGNAIRALAWMEPEEAKESLETIRQKVPIQQVRDAVDSCSTIPEWIKEAVKKEKSQSPENPFWNGNESCPTCNSAPARTAESTDGATATSAATTAITDTLQSRTQ